MSVKQIPNLTPATSLNGTEQMEAVQSGSSVKLTVAQIGTYINAQYPAPGISSVTATSPLTSSTVSGAVTIALPSQSITNAYMATMAAGTVKANITGSVSTPSDVTPSAILDTFGSTTGMTLYRGSSSWQALTAGTNAQILRANGTTSAPSWSSLGDLLNTTLGSAQGSIAYRNSSEWVALLPGTYGQVLQTQGPSADPAWVSVSGTGTVTSIATGTGLTGGPITSSGTISIANTGISAGTYGAAASIPSFSVNAQGQLTNINSVSVDGITLTTGTISSVPSNGIDIANKDYVDSVAQGLNFHAACNYGSTTALPSYVYNNGASGVGATITASANGALVLDGHTFVSPADVGLRVMIKNETSGNAPYNGVYFVTATGASGSKFVLTRATDYDSSGSGTNEIDAGDFFLILSGATLANTSWVQQTPLPIVVGTTAIVFTQFGAPVLYSAGTGLSLTGNTFSITDTAVTAGSYGSASFVGTFSVNAQGQLTLAASTSIAIAATQITTGTLAVARGGTGISSYVVGDLVYASGATALSTLADVATGNALISGGVGVAPSWSKIGLTTHVVGTLPVANGGTGQSSALTQYGVIYGSSTTAQGITAAGTTGQVLVATTGAAPSWSTISGVAVTTISFGTTGLTPATATSGAVTVAGTLAVANGGTGLATTPANGALDIGNGTGFTRTTLTAGTAISVTNASGSITVANTGVTSNVAGTGISVSGATGAVTITNNGVTSIVAGTGISVSGATGAVTVTNAGVTSFSGGSTGLTPATATTGAVSLAGTLGVGYGGTGTATAFTAGSLVFAGASGVYSQKNANLFWDNTNNRLGIGTATPAVTLAVAATDSMLIPVGTTAQRPTGATGYLRYNTDLVSFEGYNGTSWGSIGGGATGGGTDHVFYLNDQTVNSSYSIPSGQNAGTFGPITIASGATVTVPAGSTWSIV